MDDSARKADLSGAGSTGQGLGSASSEGVNRAPGRSAQGCQAAAPLSSRQIADLIATIKQSVEKLEDECTSRGDLKLLSRTLGELRHALKVFREYRGQRKVAVFGSARTPREAPAYEQAVRFGRRMAEEGWMVVTGAASGIMEAGHVGAGRQYAMGLNIMLPFEQADNHVIAGDRKLVHMRYFFTRKLIFVKESHAICLLPGGFGTLDEGLEVLTLLQTGKRDMIPVVFLDEPGGDFWMSFYGFLVNKLAAQRMIDPDDLALFRITDSVDAAAQEILGFFRVYHSMRYVRQQLVVRLNRRISHEALEQINSRFGDILSAGRFVQRGPLPEEKDEPELEALPRLVFEFNRRSFGRLRRLIDWLNSTADASA